METLRAEVLDWLTEPKADTGWLIARVSDLSGEHVTITGCALPRPGSQVELQGEYEIHPLFGAQFRVRAVLSSQPPLSRNGLGRWLRDRVAGVGIKTADTLLELFGGPHELWAVAERGASELAKRGVKPAIAEAIARAFATEGADARYQALLNSWRLTQAQIARVKKHWSLDEATRLLERDPYLLAEHIDGFGFARADEVARAMGVAHDAPARVNAAVLHQLGEASGQGHVYADAAVFRAMAREARLSLGEMAMAAKRLHDAQRVVIESSATHDRVYLPQLYLAECTVAADLATRFAIAPRATASPSESLPAELTVEQRQAVALVCDPMQRVVFVTGGPGTGKTTILRAALDELDAAGVQTMLAAPTGKAARRMSQATGRAASTLHRLLGYRPSGRVADCDHCRASQSTFDHSLLGDSDEPRTIIVDESSMVDIELMAALVNKAQHCRLVFVGDHNQLPPVGPGQPFQDALGFAPAHAVATLTQAHRSKGQWVKLAAPQILAGKPPSLDAQAGFVFVESATADGVIAALERLIDGGYNSDAFHYAEVEALNGAMPVVLSPQRRGAAGVTAINRMLHNRANPSADGLALQLEDGTEIRVGSWVMFGKNDARTGVCNGDTGKVLELMPAPKTADKPGRAIIAVDNDTADAADRLVDMSAAQARVQLRLAYASTIHKAQGMEYPWVICVCHSSHNRMLTRRLFYTAITRAKVGVIVVGDRAGVLAAVGNGREVARNTSLPERLASAIASYEKDAS